MPQLKEYVSPIDKLQPSDRGTEARTMAGRRIGGFYDQAANEVSGAAKDEATAAGDVARSVGDIGEGVTMAAKGVEQYQSHRIISQGAPAAAKIFDGLDADLNARVSEAGQRDPNDPTVAGKFREEQLEPTLQKFVEAHSGTPAAREWAEDRANRMRDHFYRKSAGDMMTLAGKAVETNIAQLGSVKSNTAFRSPESVPALIENYRSDVANIVATSSVKGAEAARVFNEISEKGIKQIVHAGAIGAIAKSPNPELAAQTFADRFPQYINGAEGQQLAGNARAQIQAARRDENFLRQNDELRLKKISEGAEGEILKRLHSDDPKEVAKVSSRAIVNDDRLSIPAKERLSRIVERELKPESDARVSAVAARDLFARIYLPAGDPNKITDRGALIEARVKGPLNKSDFDNLDKELANARTPDGEKIGTARNELVKRYAPMIDGAMNERGEHSLLGSQKTFEFIMDARRQESDLRAKGLDPTLTYDPRSEYFFAKPENIAKYYVSAQEAMKYKKTFETIRNAPRNTNQTAEGATITGSETITQPAGAKTFVPPANWYFNPARQQYRDPQGQLYDVSGNKVK